MSSPDHSKDGVYPGTSRAVYEAIEAINQSTLKHFRKTPAHARHEMQFPSAPSESMDLGTAMHTAILEPDRFEQSYVVAPKCDRRTTAGKNLWAAFEKSNVGKEHLTPQDYAKIVGMRDSAIQHPIVSEIMSSAGHNEICTIWTDKQTGLRCKGLMDRLAMYAGWTVVVDFKSTKSAAQFDFERDVSKYGYHIQAAAYLEGLNAIAEADRRFLFVAIENVEPYCCAVYELDEPSLRTGRTLFRQYLNTYAKCMAENIWPGYRQSIMSIQIPKWDLLEDA